MVSLDCLSFLRGDYSFNSLFFVIVLTQIWICSAMTSQFYLIQPSKDLTVIKSFPVTTVTSCVLQCSASSDKCHESQVETKQNGQKVCHFLQNSPPPKLEKVFKEKSNATPPLEPTPIDKPSSMSDGFSVLQFNDTCKLEGNGCPYIKGWVLQKQNVCYNVTNDELKIGRFTATQPGKISQVALVHVQGFVQFKSDTLKGYWGDEHKGDNCATDTCFGTLIVQAKTRRIVFPYGINMNERYNYNLKGFSNPRSKYITMSRGSNQNFVQRDEEFQVFIGELYRYEKVLYAGTHCIDVYFHYD